MSPVPAHLRTTHAPGAPAPCAGTANGPAARRPGRGPLKRQPRSRQAARGTPADQLLGALEAGGGRIVCPAGRVDVTGPNTARSGKRKRFARSVAEDLVSAGALHQQRHGDTVTLAITEAGKARLRRNKAHADPFAAQHGDHQIVNAGIESAQVTLNAAESPLLWLRRRKGKEGEALLGDAEFAAGERLRSDFTLSHLMPRMGADWERQGGRGVAIGLLPSEARLAAHQRVDRAMAAVGPELSGLLLDVCGFLKGLDQVERERGWPARSAKVVLCLGLAVLARHYGYANVARGPGKAKGITMWGAADYRPAFTPEPAPDARPA